MKIVDEKVSLSELGQMAENMYGGLVKAVVDVRQNIMGVDAPMHADIESFMLENGSAQADLWGINLYPDIDGEDFLEFDSMINLRPAQGNRSRGIDSSELKQKIKEIVCSLVSE